MFKQIHKFDQPFSLLVFPIGILLTIFVGIVSGILAAINNPSINDFLSNWVGATYFYVIYGTFVVAYLWYLVVILTNALSKTRLIQSGLCIISTGLFLGIFLLPSIFRLNVTPEDWFIFWLIIFPGYPVYHAIEARKYSTKKN